MIPWFLLWLKVELSLRLLVHLARYGELITSHYPAAFLDQLLFFSVVENGNIFITFGS